MKRAGLAVLIVITFAVPGRAQEVAVEPGELTRRADLVGKKVVVDDRVTLFQFHKETGYDQIFLKHAPDVTFELPPALRRQHSSQPPAAKIRGTLKREDGRWWVDVTELEILPSDLDRLNRAVGMLARSDLEARTGWVRWAEKRGQSYGDDELLARAREIEAEVIRTASEKPPARDPSAHWLALAERARTHKVPEPEPSAQAHRGFRSLLSGARTTADLKALIGRIEAFFPNAAKAPASSADLSRWERPYLNAPADAYRSAPAPVRVALDRRLWADAVQVLLERKALDDPRSLLALADEAARLLPDRPGLTERFLQKGAETASGDVGSLRQSEVDALARLYRDTLKQPEKVQELYRTWLDDQRSHRLSPRDAEGRIALAAQYETLLADRSTATSLLREAWKIDPESREVTDAFRRRGFRKVDGEWSEPSRSKAVVEAPAAASEAGKPESAPPPPAAHASDSLRNASPEVVVTRMGGKPSRKSVVATQGQVVEQWVYADATRTRYVNFLRKPGEPHARVTSYYSLPRSPSDLPGSP